MEVIKTIGKKSTKKDTDVFFQLIRAVNRLNSGISSDEISQSISSLNGFCEAIEIFGYRMVTSLSVENGYARIRYFKLIKNNSPILEWKEVFDVTSAVET